MRGTKERILLTALSLFASRGYEAVSVSDIAGALGMTKGALYRHYENKRAIFESILERMEQRDARQAGDHDLPEGSPEEMGDAYRDVSVDDAVEFAKAMFRYWTRDEFASRFRKMLTLEQFRDPEMGKLFQQYLASGPLGYMEALFAGAGLPQPRKEAAAFYAPMYLLYSVYDEAEDKNQVLSLADDLLEDAREHLKKEMRKNHGQQ